MDALLTEEKQNTLFDLSGKEYDINWVDESQPLFIPNNPAHWKAHKLQILINRLERQAHNNPAQFNSKVYKDSIDEFERLVNAINGVKTDDDSARVELDAPEVARGGDAGETPAMGDRIAPSVGVRVSTDNPFAR